MDNKRGLMGNGWSMVTRNKRYIIWFYVLNLTLAEFGVAAFRNQAHAILDNSLLSERLVHGFDVGVLVEMFGRPEFGSTQAISAPAIFFALLFFALSALFLPGILAGYASAYRYPREDFFRACGRNLWRFIRVMIIAGIVIGIASGVLFGIRGALEKAAGQSTNELLPFETSMACLLVIFLVISVLRIWFDLAEADVVLSDQRAVRRSIAKGFRHAWRGLGALLGSYIVTTIVALVILAVGLWAWVNIVPPASLMGAFLVGQITLLLLLIPRFWQRGVAVTYYLKNMVEPIAEQPIVPLAAPVPVVEPVIVVPPVVPPEPQVS